jgi:hypothetical protein
MDASQPDLSSLDVVQLTEELARRLKLDSGERSLTCTFSEGKLRRADVHAGPLRPLELLHLANGQEAG